jgi:fatty acid desaturase
MSTIPESPPRDDSADGQVMFLTFIASALIVTAAVGLLAFIPTWWMLSVALGAHITGTVIVFRAVMSSAAEGTNASDRPRHREMQDRVQGSNSTYGAA